MLNGNHTAFRFIMETAILQSIQSIVRKSDDLVKRSEWRGTHDMAGKKIQL